MDPLAELNLRGRRILYFRIVHRQVRSLLVSTCISSNDKASRPGTSPSIKRSHGSTTSLYVARLEHSGRDDSAEQSPRTNGPSPASNDLSSAQEAFTALQAGRHGHHHHHHGTPSADPSTVGSAQLRTASEKSNKITSQRRVWYGTHECVCRGVPNGI